MNQIGWKMAKIAFWSSRCETEKKMSLFKAILQSASKVRRLIKISAFHHKKLPSCGPIFFFTKKGQKSCILKVIFHSKWFKLPHYMESFKEACPVHFLSNKKMSLLILYISNYPPIHVSFQEIKLNFEKLLRSEKFKNFFSGIWSSSFRLKDHHATSSSQTRWVCVSL